MFKAVQYHVRQGRGWGQGEGRPPLPCRTYYCTSLCTLREPEVNIAQQAEYTECWRGCLPYDILLSKYFTAGQPRDRQETPVYCWCRLVAENVLQHTYPLDYQIFASQPRQKSCWANSLCIQPLGIQLQKICHLPATGSRQNIQVQGRISGQCIGFPSSGTISKLIITEFKCNKVHTSNLLYITRFIISYFIRNLVQNQPFYTLSN